MRLIYVSCLWIAGTFLGLNLDLPVALGLTGLVPLCLLFFGRGHRKLIISAGLGLVTLFIAAAYSNSSLHKVSENTLDFYNERGTLEVKGMVAKEPEAGDKGTRLKLSVTEIKLDSGWRTVRGTALLFVPRYPAYQYGDVLGVTGRPETPPQLNDFDYKGYLAQQGIYTTVAYPKIEVLERGKGSKLLEMVYSLRSRLAETMARALPEPQASLAQGIILGMRGNIPAPVKDDFYRTGTTHLLAISGLHLGIVAGILLGLGIWLFGRRRHLYIWLALGIIWFYALLTGLQPPVVRAAIMASLFLTAELLGRQRSAITALSFAAAVMVGISPSVLAEASFQLSFLAMAGLVFLFPGLQSLGRRALKAALGEGNTIASIASMVSDSLAVTLAAVIAVWPVIAYYFGIISLVGPLATLLVLPALPGIILTGALTGLVGLVFLPAAQVIGWSAWAILAYMLFMVGSLARPFAFIETGAVNPGWVWAYYPALAAAIWLGRRWRRQSMPEFATRLRSGASRLASRIPGKWVIPPLLAVAVLVSLVAATMPDDRLRVSFLDVGEGDAVLIQKGSTQVLVDGGPSPRAINLALGKQMPFWDRTIELVVSTHPHQDHVGGLVEVLKHFQVGQVLYPGLDYNSPTYAEWLRLVEIKGINSTIAGAGQQINLGGGAIIAVLNPPPAPFTGTRSDIDNNSVVLRLSLGKFSFLLTGDIMESAEWELVRQRANLASTVLKAAHHGSATSTTAEFLAVVDPQVAVISAGAGNRLGHPDSEVLDRLEKRAVSIYRTDRHGTIEFVTDGEKLWLKPQTGRIKLK